VIEFPFEARQSRKLGQVLKPIIPVRIIGPARAVNLLMLLDSGADLSLLPSNSENSRTKLWSSIAMSHNL